MELDGRAIESGRLDLVQALGSGRPSVDGMTLSFTSPPQRSPQDAALAAEIFGEVRDGFSGPTPWAQKLASLEPERGARVFEAILDLARLEEGDPEKLGKLGAILRCKELEPIVLTGLDRLADQGRQAALHGTISPGGHWPGQRRLALYEPILKHLDPNERFLREQLGPFMRHPDFTVSGQGFDLARRLIEKNPMLAGPAMEIAFEQGCSSEQARALRQKALELGWLPGPSQIEQVMADLVQLPGAQRNTALNNDSFVQAVDFLGKLPQEMTSGLMLPGQDGSLVPLGRAVLERLANEWTDAAARHTALSHGETRENSFRGRLYSLIGDQPDIAQALLERVHVPGASGEDAQRDLGLLSGLPLTTAQLDSLADRFRDDLLSRPLEHLGALDGRLRSHLVRRELARPGETVSQRLAQVRDLVALQLFGQDGASYEALMEKLCGGWPAQLRHSEAARLLEELREVLPQGLQAAPQAGDLVALEFLSRGQEDLRLEVQALLPPDPQLRHRAANERLLALPWHRESWSRCNRLLVHGGTTPAETYAPFLEAWNLVQQVTDLDRSWEAAVAAWRQGLPPQATEALRPLGEHQVIAFGLLVPDSPTWGDLVRSCGQLLRTHERLGSPEHFGETEKLWSEVKQLIQGGLGFETALETAYARFRGLPAPAAQGSSLREQQDHVAIGSVRLRRRRV